MKVTGKGQRSHKKKKTNGDISESNKPIDIIPGTKVQYNNRHFLSSAILTLTKGQGHTTW